MYNERTGLYTKSKQIPLIEKRICLTILSVNLVYKCSEIYLSYSLILPKVNNS